MKKRFESRNAQFCCRLNNGVANLFAGLASPRITFFYSFPFHNFVQHQHHEIKLQQIQDNEEQLRGQKRKIRPSLFCKSCPLFIHFYFFWFTVFCFYSKYAIIKDVTLPIILYPTLSLAKKK